MDRPVQHRGPDTNMIEIKKIVDCLVRNGYEFEGTREAVDGRYTYQDDAIADFSKKLDYTAEDGDYKNDSIIKVSIHFEKRADYTNFEKNEDEDDIYIGDPRRFISDLVEEIGVKRRTLKRTSHFKDELSHIDYVPEVRQNSVKGKTYRSVRNEFNNRNKIGGMKRKTKKYRKNRRLK